VISNQEWNDVLERLVYEGLIEGAQGFSLGINSGFYPFCTSRDTGPARFLSDCAVPHTLLRIVVGTARTYPIRVGNTPGGFSGGGYFDQHELTWESLGLKPETTTVTGRERRIFSFSNQQILEAIQAFRPDCVFLNFCNYIGTADDDPQVETMTNAIIDLGSPVVYLGWGAAEQDIQELGKYEC
jgi:adenylosuccinate synthase